MSTPAIIGRTVSTTGWFIGRYHNWSGYIEGLGKTLYKAYHQDFNKDIEKMMHFLIDEHPAGWSNIVDQDLSLAPGFSTFQSDVGLRDDHKRYFQQIEAYNASERGRRAQCYCHGERHNTEVTIRTLNDPCAAEYAYIINETSCIMTIHYCHFGTWHEVIKVDLNGDEPHWKDIDINAVIEAVE